MNRTATIIAASLLALTAHAAESGIQWDPVTRNEDGSAIEGPLTYIVEWGEDGAFTATESTTNATLTVTHRQNKWICARVKAVNEVGAESAWSDVLIYAIKVRPAKPGRPTMTE